MPSHHARPSYNPFISAAETDIPPPPPPSDLTTQWEVLPPDWATATSPQDGRIYYWEKSSGKTSWTHPLAKAQPPQGGNPSPIASDLTTSQRGMFNRPWNMFQNRSEMMDTPWNAARRPNNHQCYAVTALVLFFPFGLCAMYQSISVDRAWSEGHYGDAVNHSRQASQYACFGTFVGVVFWLWFFFAKELGRIEEWFQFN